jgi:hypothetical protein
MRLRHLPAVALLALAVPARAAAQTPAAGAGATTPRRAAAGAPEAPARPAGANKAGIAIGDVAWVAGQVMRAEPPQKQIWRPLVAGDKVRTGDTLRTAADAVATISFPWMEVSLGPSSMLSIPATAVLSTVVDQGRVEFSGAGRDIVKIVVGDAEVRGGGQLVLRRTSALTTASALKGTFRVRAMGRRVEIRAGEGTAVRAGAPPSLPAPLPAAPTDLQPGAEVTYLRAGRPIDLRWKAGSSAGYHVEVLALQGEQVLLARDSLAPTVRIELPWLGTYRWRSFSRDERGFESRPSAEGLISVVER